RNSRGTVLILALWALGMLSIFIIGIGAQLRQKIELVSRLESREELCWLARSGVEKGKFVFSQAHNLSGDEQPLPASWQRLRWLNNPRAFRQVRMGKGFFEVKYDCFDERRDGARTLYGFIDEERKINVNRADAVILARLIESVLRVDHEKAQSLARSVIDWRVYGDSEIEGFLSDEYYDNLEFPYPEKKADFENIAELHLLEGWTPEVCQRLEPYLTVYGNGQVNVNTASASVLFAVGFPGDFVDMVLSVRRGPDGMDWTGDDVLFETLPEMVTALMSFATLTQDDVQLVNDLSARGRLGTQSYYYRIDSYARMVPSGEKKKVSCVFFAPSRKTLYWRES
ncbi:MAG TPA: type II secretion system protein GspK, partial [Candidatus Omnitrophota bacterium]|nr:type II secretion system protein GspK [Candidatus Omnitrophota bacterium]